MSWRGKISLRAKSRGRDRGQTLILIMLAMPLFFALMSLVVDGGNILVHKRNIQVAADAAALAMSQSINLATSPATCPASCVDEGRAYAKKNGIDVDATSPSWHKCDDSADPAHPTDTNCWAFPYVNKNDLTHPHYDQAEVRLRAHVTTFIAGVVGIYSANVSARAVGGANPVYGYSTTPGTTIQGTTVITTIPGGTHTTTDPDTNSGGSGIAFAMSRVCNAISYSGSGSGTWDQAIASGQPGSISVLGAFATNGGVDFSGNAPKKMTWLGFDQTRCGPLGSPANPPSGTSQCQAKAWNTPPGSGTDSTNLCVQTLVNLNQNNTLPINWPLPPPPQPTPKSGAWVPANDYFGKCINLGGASISFTTTGHPPGIYCVSGAATTLTLSNVGDLTTGDGYTFFALGGATISVSGNTNKLKFYWPSACGAGTRPTTRASSYPCPGLNRTITGYDPFTLFYATNPSPGLTCAICLQGQSNVLTGDIFAPMPAAFPPTPGLTQTGGLVKINGGALGSGSGFIESWNLQIAGNTGSYTGTGTSIVIPGATHTTTDTGTVSTSISTGTTIAGSVQVTTSGTTVGLGE